MKEMVEKKFKNKKVLVVGFGVSGEATVRFLIKEGAKVAVTESCPCLKPVPKGITELHVGGHPTEIFQGRDLIVVSPGVPLNLPGFQLARRKKIPIIGEFGLAAELLKDPMIAVTGTNGKSTTVTLISKILKKAGKKVALAGNIGKPLLEVVMEGKKNDWVVAEVSSYQLETVRKFHPKVSVILNVTEDHLDRYPSFEAYARVKMRIFKEQGPKDLLIYNDVDPVVRKGIRGARARKIGFSSADPFPFPRDKIKLVGLHNVENMLASIAVARSLRIPSTVIQKTLESFEGLPHRTEFVRELQGVRYYDDSKGTNVDAVVKSLAGFPEKKVILIAGGRDKGGSYRPLREMAQKKVKLMILIGEARRKIAREMEGAGFGIASVEKLEHAVPVAAERSEAGDSVILSPGCSSFDQFKDYKERGDLFQKMVREL